MGTRWGSHGLHSDNGAMSPMTENEMKRNLRILSK